MGIKFSFKDDVIYGTDDINEIAGCLTGAGVMPFETKESYLASDLNQVTAALTTSGTSLGGCRCSLEDAGLSNMRVRVSQGIVFFESGVRLMVDADGFSADVPPNTRGYVFAHYSPSLQNAEIRFDTVLPEDGEYVELARLSDTGELTLVRQFARSRVGTMGKNVSLMTELTYHTPVLYEEGDDENLYIAAKADGAELSGYNYALIMEQTEENAFDATYMGLFSLETEDFPLLINRGEVWYNCPNRKGFFRTSPYIDEGSRYFKVIDGELCLLVAAKAKQVEGYGIRERAYTVLFL